MLRSRACAALLALLASAAGAQTSNLLGALETELVYSPASHRVGTAQESGNAVRYSGWAPSYLRAATRWYPSALFIGAYADARFETFALTGAGFIPGKEIDELRVYGGHLGAGVTARFSLSATLALDANVGFAWHSLPFGVYDPSQEDTGAVRALGLGFLGPTVGGAARWTPSDVYGAELRLSALPFSLFGGAAERSGSGRAVSVALQAHAGRFALGQFDLQPTAGYELTVADGSAATVEATLVAHRLYLGARGLFGTLRGERVKSGPGWIRGRIRAPDGTPLAGAVVALAAPAQSTVTAADGTFRLREIAPGPAVLEISAEGYRPARAEVVVAPEAELVQELTLERRSGPGRIRGRVLVRNTDGTGGAPLANAEIQGPDAAVVKVGADGTFTLDAVGPGLVTLFIRAPGHPPQEEVVSVPPEGEAELEVSLAPAKQRTLASLRGRVRSVRGAPVAASLRIPEAQVATRAGKDGKFVVRLPGGRYTVVFSAPGFVTQTKTVEVADGDQALFYVDLSPEER